LFVVGVVGMNERVSTTGRFEIRGRLAETSGRGEPLIPGQILNRHFQLFEVKYAGRVDVV
jgi:hypothetical protein